MTTTLERREDFQARFREKLVHYDHKLAVLKQKVEIAEGRIKPELEEEIARLRQKQDELAGKVAQLQGAAGETGYEIKADMESAEKDLDRTYERILALF